MDIFAFLIQSAKNDELTTFQKQFPPMKKILDKIDNKKIFVTYITDDSKVYFTVDLVTDDEDLVEDLKTLVDEQDYTMRSHLVNDTHVINIDKGCTTDTVGNDLKAIWDNLLSGLDFDFKILKL